MRKILASWQLKFKSYWSTRSASEQGNLRLAAIILVLLSIGGPLAYFVGRPAWNNWRLERTLAQAKAYEAAQDYPQLMIALRRAAQMGSSDIETWKRIADTLSRLGSEQAVVARGNVVALAPDDWESRIAYATEALRFGQTAQARDALDVNSTEFNRDVAYERVAARLALLLGDHTSVTEHLHALLELDPENNEARLLLALVQAWSLDATTRATGQAGLENLLDAPPQQVRASLELLKFAARQRDGALAARIVALLRRKLPPAPKSHSGADELETVIVQLQTAAATDPDDASTLAAWLGEIRRKPAALAWLQSLPAEIRDQPAPMQTAAELALAENQLDAAFDYLRRGALGPLPTPTILLMLSARQLHQIGRNDIANETWKSAIRLAEASPADYPLRTLSRIASIWQQATWARDTLEAALTRNPNAWWAYEALREQALAQADATRLWQLYDRWIERQPDNLAVVNPWLRLGMVLPVADTRLTQRAPELLDALPASPAAFATRAGWLWHEGLQNEAEVALQKAGDATSLSADAAYWVALVAPVADPLKTFPQLTRLTLLPAEAELLAQAFRDKNPATDEEASSPRPEAEAL